MYMHNTWSRHIFASNAHVLRDKQRWLLWLASNKPLAAVPVPNVSDLVIAELSQSGIEALRVRCSLHERKLQHCLVPSRGHPSAESSLAILGT